MSATATNGKPTRNQLADQLDRLDGIIDTLAEGLNQAVADAKTRADADPAPRNDCGLAYVPVGRHFARQSVRRAPGAGCKPAKLKLKATRRGTLQLAGELAAIRLRKGTRLELRITRAGTVGAVIRFSGRKRGIPTRRDLCLPPGGKPGRC